MIRTVETKKQWFIVYTRPGCEKKVVTLLEKKRIEAYCPFNRAYLIDRKRAITEPLFPSYVFVKASDTEHTSIIETDGFVNFVYWLAKPAVICQGGQGQFLQARGGQRRSGTADENKGEPTGRQIRAGSRQNGR